MDDLNTYHIDTSDPTDFYTIMKTDPEDEEYIDDSIEDISATLKLYELDNERLKILLGNLKNFGVGYGTALIRSGYVEVDDKIPRDVKSAQNRAIIGMFNQVERLSNREIFRNDLLNCDDDDDDDDDELL